MSFAGLAPDEIRTGLRALGRVVEAGLEDARQSYDPAPALV